MPQSVFDRVWNGSPAGGLKINGAKPVHFLRSNVPAPPRPVLRPAPARSTLIQEVHPPRHGRVWLYAFLSVLIFIGAWAYFGGYQAEASGRTTHHPETTVEQQRNEVASTSEHDTPASITGAIIVRKPMSGGVICPNASSASAPYLAGVQTDPACLRYAPSMRR